MRVQVDTVCAHCGVPIRMDLDSDLESAGRMTEPLVFSPNVDWEHFRAPNIIDDF